MQLLLPVYIAIGTLLGLVKAATLDYYATKYDHIDVDGILNNRRMVNFYAACLLSEGPCPPEGMEFKRILPESLRTNCLKCTEKQKTVTLRAIRRLKKEYPKIWNRLAEQWDPDDLFVKKFEATFASTVDSSSTSSVQFENRFGDGASDETQNAISQAIPASSTTSSTSRTPTTSSRPLASSVKTTRKATTTKLTTTTNKPNINRLTTKTTQRPRPDIGASIQATVSLGTNIVGELVRGLGALGNRVVETGAQIAGVVVKNIFRPL